MFWFADRARRPIRTVRRCALRSTRVPCDDRAATLFRAQRGFVLLEAVIAMALLSAVVLALLSATGGQLRTATDMTGMVTAQALAEDRITAFRLLDYEGLRSPPDSLMAGTFPVPLDGWSWKALVQEDEYDLFQVGVTVSGPGAVFPLETSIHRARPEIGGSDRGGGTP